LHRLANNRCKGNHMIQSTTIAGELEKQAPDYEWIKI